MQTVLQKDRRVHRIANRYFITHQWWTEAYKGYSEKENIINIVSEENMVLQSGNFGKLVNTLFRIKKVRPDAHIILTIREQRKLLESRYKFNIPHPRGFSHSFASWLKSGQGMDYLSLCLYENLFRVINLYFPKEHIHFLLFEELEKQPDVFFRGFYKILDLEAPQDTIDVKENVSLSTGELKIILWLNRFKLFRSDSLASRFEAALFRRIAKPFKNVESLPDSLRWGKSRLFKELEKEFAETNRKLLELDIFSRKTLVEYGYLL